MMDKRISDVLADDFMGSVQKLGDRIKPGWANRHKAKLDEWRLMMYAYNRSLPGLIGFLLALGFVVMGVFGPFLATYRYNEFLIIQNPDYSLKPPGAYGFAIGTDFWGRDLFSLLLQGARVSLIISIVTILLCVPFGIVLGLMSGYIGGKVDELIMRVTDIFIAFPGLVLAIAFAIVLPPRIVSLLVGSTYLRSFVAWLFAVEYRDVLQLSGVISVIIAMVIVWWPSYTRVIRGSVLSARENLFIEAARALGVSTWRILWKHILPNIVGPILVLATLDFGSVIITEAALSFLGLGAQDPIPEWGATIYAGSQFFPSSWWLIFFPGVCVFTSALSWNLIGDTLRDVLDPKTRRSIEFKVKKKVPVKEKEALEKPLIAPVAASGGISGSMDNGPRRILEVKDLTVSFYTYAGVVKALDSVSFDVFEGETLCLVGETGCGKTVTSRAITRLIPSPGEIVKGQILFHRRGGEVVNILDLSEEELRKIRGAEVAYIFQDPTAALDPLYNVNAQLIETMMAHGGVSKDEATKKAVEMLVSVRIPDSSKLVKRYPHELSGGMKQRVVIGTSLLNSPRLLIADEPTSNIDVTIQAQLLSLLTGLKQDIDMTILLITHNMGIVAEVGDRVAVMYAGKIVEIASVEDLFRTPLHPYTQGLLRAVPNPLKKVERLESISGTIPNLINPPKGCRFHPRCPYAFDRCPKEEPKLIEVEPAHYAACFLLGLRGIKSG